MTKHIVSTERAPKAVGPYSQAVDVDGILFISGQLPIAASTGEMLRGDIREQTRQAMENVRAILQEAGRSLSDIIKATIYLKDMEDFGAVNEAYGEFFPAAPPARACLEAARLPKDAEIMVDCIAARSESNS